MGLEQESATTLGHSDYGCVQYKRKRSKWETHKGTPEGTHHPAKKGNLHHNRKRNDRRKWQGGSGGKATPKLMCMASLEGTGCALGDTCTDFNPKLPGSLLSLTQVHRGSHNACRDR